MLVLSRKKEEAIYIDIPPMDTNKKIRIDVVEIAANKIRLGFTADKEISIMREELLEVKKK